MAVNFANMTAATTELTRLAQESIDWYKTYPGNGGLGADEAAVQAEVDRHTGFIVEANTKLKGAFVRPGPTPSV